MTKRMIALPGVALSIGMVATALASTPATADAADASSERAVYFAARMVGEEEVPGKDAKTKKVNDEDGSAIAVFRIKGDKVSWAIRWEGIGTPSGFHIHQGVKGKNGDVVIPFFGEAMPESALALMGTVTVKDKPLLDRIKKNPKGWYANIHNAEFPGGALRAQLHKIHPIRLSKVLATPAKRSLFTVADGDQEVKDKQNPKVGDPDGRAEWLFLVNHEELLYAAAWDKVKPPTGAHIHRAPKGKNGPVTVPFFADKNGLPSSISGIAGAVKIKADLAKRLRTQPRNWYANIHNLEFPNGAVRGQLYRYHGGW